MISTQELLEKEEKEAMDALQNNLKEAEDAKMVEKNESDLPETKDEVQPEVEQPNPEVKEEVKIQEPKIDFEKYENEFKALGIKLEPEKANDPTYLKSRFLTTSGILNKQSSELKALKDEVERIRQENAQLKTKAVSFVPEQRVEVNEDITKLKQDLLNDFDGNEKVIEKLDAYFEAKNRKSDREIREKLSEIEKKHQEAEATRVYNEFWENVFKNTPEARDVLDKENYAFKAFLEQPQSHFNSMLNRNLYEDACNRGDARTVAQLFKDYVSETRDVSNENNKPNNIKQDVIPEVVKKQISPKSLSATSVQTRNEAKKWTIDEINNVYDRATAGRISRADADKLMKEIDLAISEGRVSYK